MYVELYVIMFITWLVEIEVIHGRNSFDNMIIADAIKCLTTVLIFIIFVMNKNVRGLVCNRFGIFGNSFVDLVAETS